MSSFTTPLIVELIGKNLWRVYEEFEYHIGEYPSDEIIKVPVGTITDFASVPRIFWFIISPVDRHGKAAVIHDYCYNNKLYSRKKCDEIFLESMSILGVHKWKRYIMYWCVRLFSGFVWFKKR